MQVRGEVKGKRATGGERTQEQGRRKRSEPGEEESRQSQVKAGRPRAGKSGQGQGRREQAGPGQPQGPGHDQDKFEWGGNTIHKFWRVP